MGLRHRLLAEWYLTVMKVPPALALTLRLRGLLTQMEAGMMEVGLLALDDMGLLLRQTFDRFGG